MRKIKISKNTVQETLLIPLYGRKIAMELYPDLFHDEDCISLFNRIDWNAPKENKIKEKVGGIMAATRQFDMISASKEYIKTHPNACVINLGCGLDTSITQINNGTVKGYNIDFPDVTDIRNNLLIPCKNEKNVACDLTDSSWFDKIDFKENDGAVFFASGVFYYFKTEDVKALFCKMAKRFPGAKLVFDATNSKGLKNMLKTWLKPSEMENIGLYFSVESEKDIRKWSDNFKSVTRKGYMTGYRPLDKRFGKVINFVFKFADKSGMCQVIEIEFA